MFLAPFEQLACISELRSEQHRIRTSWLGCSAVSGREQPCDCRWALESNGPSANTGLMSSVGLELSGSRLKRDQSRCLDSAVLWAFLEETQPGAWSAWATRSPAQPMAAHEPPGRSFDTFDHMTHMSAYGYGIIVCFVPWVQQASFCVCDLFIHLSFCFFIYSVFHSFDCVVPSKAATALNYTPRLFLKRLQTPACHGQRCSFSFSTHLCH